MLHSSPLSSFENLIAFVDPEAITRRQDFLDSLELGKKIKTLRGWGEITTLTGQGSRALVEITYSVDSKEIRQACELYDCQIEVTPCKPVST